MFRIVVFENFLIDPIVVARRRRHRALVLGALAGVVIGAVGAQYVPDHSLPRVSAAFDRLSAASTEFFAGGDAEVSPPVFVPPPPPIPERSGSSTAPSFFSASVLVKDQVSGAVLFGKDEYARRPIASITKLMSALVLLERGRFFSATATTTVAVDDIADTHMHAGETYAYGDLWRAMLVGSSNKAVLTLVDGVWHDRTAFVSRMNDKARELGLADTVFVEPTGLDERNISTASDVALLLKEALSQEDIRLALLTHEQTLVAAEAAKPHHLWNTNWLLLRWIPHTFAAVRGGKTGYIPTSGYNVAVEVANTDEHVLDVVVLGALGNEERFTEARDAAAWTFENFRWPE